MNKQTYNIPSIMQAAANAAVHLEKLNSCIR